MRKVFQEVIKASAVKGTAEGYEALLEDASEETAVKGTIKGADERQQFNC